MGIDRLLRACLMALIFAAASAARPAAAQSNFDRPGGDYLSSAIPSGDPADCALLCERDKRCHAWSFNYPTDPAIGAMCWLKSSVPARRLDFLFQEAMRLLADIAGAREGPGAAFVVGGAGGPAGVVALS